MRIYTPTLPPTPVSLTRVKYEGSNFGSNDFFFKKTGRKPNLDLGYSGMGCAESTLYFYLSFSASAPVEGLPVMSKGGFFGETLFFGVKKKYGLGHGCWPLLYKPTKHVPFSLTADTGSYVTTLFFVSRNQAFSYLEPLSIRAASEKTQLALTLCSKATKLRGIITVFELNPEKKARLRVNPHHAVLAEIPAASIAAMFGYSRRYQRASFIRISFFKHLRRYLLTLNQLSLDLRVVGILRQFRLLFKTLNAPANQIFKHPLYDSYLTDFYCVPQSLYGLISSREELRSYVKTLVLENSLTSDENLPEFTAAVSDEHSGTVISELTTFFWSRLQRIFSDKPKSRPKREALLCRYVLLWNKVVFLKTNAHTLIKKKRARSIKKRRTKRLVKKAKYRF
jgi:hypothetical protein